MLCNYHQITGRYIKPLGEHEEGEEWRALERHEFLVILHLAARHYETEGGRSSPSLVTIAKEMGYSVRGLHKVIRSLKAKGMLKITPRPGRTSIYSCQPFAEACLELWQGQQEDTPELEFTPEPQFTPTPELEFTPPMNLGSPETKETRTRKKNTTTACCCFSIK